MRFRVKKNLVSKGDGKLYKPGEVYDDGGRNTEYQVELLISMGVVERLKDEPTPAPVEFVESQEVE